MEYTYFACKLNVGAGISTSLSMSNGLGPFIFCRKMASTRPKMEEMDGKGVSFPRQSAFPLWLLPMKVPFPMCILTGSVNNYVSRQGKCIYRIIESRKRQIFVLLRLSSIGILEN